MHRIRAEDRRDTDDSGDGIGTRDRIKNGASFRKRRFALPSRDSVQDLREEILRTIRLRIREERFLLIVLDDEPAIHEDHAIRHLLRKAHFVRHAHHGHAFLREFDHHVEHFVDHLRIERGRRLVEEHRDRVHRQRARNRHALLLTAGQLARKLVRMRAQADAIQQLHALLRGFVARTAEHLDLRERQVLRDRQMRKQLEVLEHHADLRTQLRQIRLLVRQRLAVDRDFALLERLQAVHGLDERRLARTRRAAHHDDLALLHFGRAVGEHLELPVPLGNILDRDHLATFF
ncbi:6-pyruvoyl-tetrahydropterin synthase [Burkholderia sp. SJ98]|nr:6-pyruvoyl-tetrahydropterin synthase [Burkholderia sp. SJ98]